MRKIIIKIISYIKTEILNNVMKHIYVDKNVIIKCKARVISRRGNIELNMGSILEKNVRLSAIDGGYLTVGKNVYFNEYCRVICRDKIMIGDNTLFGPNVCIFDHDHTFDYNGVSRDEFKCSPVIIEENCWIGVGTIILRGTHIGKGTIIGAGSIVKGEIPAHSLVKCSKDVIIENLRKV